MILYNKDLTFEEGPPIGVVVVSVISNVLVHEGERGDLVDCKSGKLRAQQQRDRVLIGQSVCDQKTLKILQALNR